MTLQRRGPVLMHYSYQSISLYIYNTLRLSETHHRIICMRARRQLIRPALRSSVGPNPPCTHSQAEDAVAWDYRTRAGHE